MIDITTNDTFPFLPLEDPKAMLQMQLNKTWKFRSRTEQAFSEAYKSFIRQMLEPDTKKRIRTDEAMRHQWMVTTQRDLP